MKQKLKFTPEIAAFIKSFDAEMVGNSFVYTIPLKFVPVEGKENVFEIDFEDRLIQDPQTILRNHPMTYKEAFAKKLH